MDVYLNIRVFSKPNEVRIFIFILTTKVCAYHYVKLTNKVL